jgi:hypothetical protein
MEASEDTPSAKACSDAGATRGGEDQRIAFQRLDRLAEVGHRIIAAIGAQLSALAGADQCRRFLELADVYDRVGWALRLIVALGLRLNREAKALARSAEISAERPDPSEGREGLDRESGDRFDLDGFGPILKRPVDEVVAIICEALGATPEWRRWAEAAWTGGDINGDDDDAPASEPLDCPRWSRRPQARLARSLARGPRARAAPS